MSGRCSSSFVGSSRVLWWRFSWGSRGVGLGFAASSFPTWLMGFPLCSLFLQVFCRCGAASLGWHLLLCVFPFYLGLLVVSLPALWALMFSRVFCFFGHLRMTYWYICRFLTFLYIYIAIKKNVCKILQLKEKRAET